VIRLQAVPEALAPNGLDMLTTEAVRPDLHDLDMRPIGEVVALLVAARVRRTALWLRRFRGLRRRPRRSPRGSSAVPADLRRRRDARSARVLDAAECEPTFNTDIVRGVIAGGPAALTQAIDGAEDAFDPADLADLTAADALVGISASGRTPYVLGALNMRARRALSPSRSSTTSAARRLPT